MTSSNDSSPVTPARAPHDLTGRNVVVTGGNGGIGLGLAHGVARAGARVAIWGRNVEKNKAALAQLHAAGADAIAICADIQDEDQVRSAFAESVSALGRVDAFFANAGVPGEMVAFVDMTLQQWREVLSVNLDGTFLCLREAARHMVANGGGHHPGLVDHQLLRWCSQRALRGE